jgi:drug/metabolite transporter (DMT)-like permease
LISDVVVAASRAGGGREVAGAAVALCSAALYDVGYLLEKQALSGVPADVTHPVALVRSVARSRRWIAGFAAMAAGLGLQVVALTMAPVSVVQPVLAGGLLGLVAVSGVVLGERLTKRQLAALAFVLLGVLAVALSARAGGTVATGVSRASFAELAGPLAALGALAAWAGLRGGARVRGVGASPRNLVNFAVGAGILYGLGAVSEKAVATHLSADGLASGALHSLGTAYPWVFVIVTLGGMLVFQSGLQRHPASMMASFTNVTASVCALAGASAVFGEPVLPDGWWSVARVLGLALIGLAIVALISQKEPAMEVAAVP